MAVTDVNAEDLPNGTPTRLMGIDADDDAVLIDMEDIAEPANTLDGTDGDGNVWNPDDVDLANWAGGAFDDWLLKNSAGKWRQSVRVVDATNGTLATAYANGQSAGGVTLATNDHILLVGRTSQAENGPYVVQASGAPVRRTDGDSSSELLGAMYLVREGYGRGSVYRNTNASTITVGTTALTYDLVIQGTAKGADVASGSTVTFGPGGTFDMTGTGTVGAFAFTHDFAGRRARVRATGASSLTNSSSLIVEGGQSIPLASGDTFDVVSLASGNVYISGLKRASGAFTAVTPSGGNVAINGAAVRPNISVAASGAIDFNSFTNLVVGQTYEIEVSMTGGPYAITATGAGRTFNFGAGISVPSGKGAVFAVKHNGSQVCVFFCGYRD